MAGASFAHAGPSAPLVAVAILGLHVALLAAVYWRLDAMFVARGVVSDRAAISSAVEAYAWRMLAAEAITITLGAVIAVALVQRAKQLSIAPAIAWAAAHVPPAIYSTLLLMAFAAGWEADAWVLSRPGAGADEIRATVTEALPFVLRQMQAGRDAANAAAIVLFAVLLRRQAGVSHLRAMAAAGVAGAVVVIVRVMT